MSRFRSLPLFLALGAGVAAVAWAATPNPPSAPPPAAAAPAADTADAKATDPRVVIAKRLGASVEDVRPSAINGLYEVAHGAEVLYVTADSHYVIDGDLYDAEKKINLTDERRSAARRAALATIGDDKAIIFGAATARYTITVFTDVDCAYCRKLHSQINEYNKLGIRVRYLFYPRTGPDTPSWHKAEAVWCSANRQDALTRAKLGQDIAVNHCATPVARTYALGQDLGMRGTPGIFTEHGEYIAGYLSPEQMLERLKLDGSGPVAAN